MKCSNHAKNRIQQRGFNNSVLTAVEEIGDIEYRPGGALRLKISRREKNRLISQLKKQINLVERAAKKAIIVSADDFSAITAYHLKR